MREIKFRQRIKLQNGEEFWHYWGFCNADGTTNLDVFRSAHLSDDLESYQFTGYKDINQKEVYEGNIVRAQETKSYSGVIVWWKDRWALSYLSYEEKQIQSLSTVLGLKIIGDKNTKGGEK